MIDYYLNFCILSRGKFNVTKMPHRIRLSEEIRDLEGDLSYADCAKIKTEHTCWYSGAADYSRAMNSIDQIIAGLGYITIDDVWNCVSCRHGLSIL